MYRLRQRSRFGLLVAVTASSLIMSFRPAPLVAACVGDCNSDGAVTVDELLQGVNIALGATPVTLCPAIDVNGDSEVTINELLAAVNAALAGCPVNHAPDVPCFAVYEGFPAFQISFPINAVDADNDSLQYSAPDLPAGATLDAHTGVFSWTPAADQFGTFYVPFTVTDSGAPPRSTDGLLSFRVSAPDACQQVACDPATGCTSTLQPLSQPCCTDFLPRVAEPLTPCPAGLALFIGRNTSSGTGRLEDCDRLQVVNSAQTSATVRLNIEARCLNAVDPVTVHVRLVTKSRLVFDSGVLSLLDPGHDGFMQRATLAFPVQTAGPFFDLDGADAILTATLTDSNGVSVSTQVRPTLGFTRLDDLIDLDAPPPSGQVSCP